MVLGSTVYFYRGFIGQRGPVYTYEQKRDLAPILELFKTDTYWLLANPGTDPAFLITHKTPSEHDPFYFGKLHVKVLREDEKFIGFVAYYKKTFREGFLLFVAIKPEFRGKRYAQTLVQYAVDELRRLGAARVSLVTRTDNVRAQALYNRLGFTETQRDEGFVYYIKSLKD